MLWKQVERQVAKKLEGQRVPITGRARGSSPDIEHPYLSIEVKEKEEFPKWLHEAMEQAKAASRKKTPVVVLHEKGKKYSDDYVILKMDDFIKMVIEKNKEIDRLSERLADIYNHYKISEEQK